jgi:eukaryotic-like serine/threonine-protein kinase
MVEPGQVLDGKYRIVRLIGEGGMGAVFEGENVRISRRVAIKVLHGAALEKAETVQRFEREAQAAGRIGSDHILEILDLGTLSDGERYMVMEFLNGETLSARIKHHTRLTPEQIVPLIRQALVGLGAAHQAGIIHRDLKPDNIFVLHEKTGIRDYVKIIDFGISKFNALGGDMNMTRTGAVMGTPYYMSPEQAKGSGGVDHRSDIYAIGVILYEAVTGEVPFTGNTFNELMFKIVLSEPRPLAQVIPNLDPRFTEIVTRAMAREPGQRFANADEMIKALDALGYGGKAVPATVTNPQVFQGQAPPVAQAPFAQSSGGAVGGVTAGTQGTFATSQQGVPGAASRRSGLGVAVGAAVLVLGGGAFAAYKVFGGKPADAPVPAAEAPASAAPPAAVSVAPAGEPKVEPAPPPATAAPATAAPPPPEPVASTSAAPPPVAAKAIAGRPATPGPRPARPTPAAAKPDPNAAKSSRDFGY